MPGVRGFASCGSERAHGHLYSRRLRELALRHARQPISTISLKTLSIGMSNGYHVVVVEGATMVRVGRTILGARGA